MKPDRIAARPSVALLDRVTRGAVSRQTEPLIQIRQRGGRLRIAAILCDPPAGGRLGEPCSVDQRQPTQPTCACGDPSVGPWADSRGRGSRRRALEQRRSKDHSKLRWPDRTCDEQSYPPGDDSFR